MDGKKKRLVWTIGIAAGIVIVASAGLRIFMTRDRLVPLILPRIEKAVGAKIEIGDIGVRFPFGFGVNVDDLSFRKELPEARSLDFTSGRVEVKVSLLSLIRRRPDFRKVHLTDGSVRLERFRPGIDLVLSGVSASLSMVPGDSLYEIGIEADISSAGIRNDTNGRTLEAGRVVVSATLNADMSLSSLEMPSGSVVIAEKIKFDLSGTIEDINGAGRYDFSAASSRSDLAGLADYITGLDLSVLSGGKETTGKGNGLPVELLGGTVILVAEGSGAVSEAKGLSVSGQATIEGASLKPKDIDIPVLMGGSVSFSEKGVESKGFRIDSGNSSVLADIKVGLDAGMKPETAEIGGTYEIDFGAISEILPGEGPGLSGKLKGDISCSGRAAALVTLFPGVRKDLTAGIIKQGWEDIALGGSFTIENSRISMEGSPLAVEKLAAAGKISKGDLTGLRLSMEINGSPWTLSGRMSGIMPCLAELVLIAGAPVPPKDAGSFLDSVRNVPDIYLAVAGRSFDMRPFAKDAEEKKASASVEQASSGAVKKGGSGGAGAAVFLINTGFELKMDSLITESATFTSIAGKGKIERGRLHASPLTVKYAGGSGEGNADIDMRDQAHIRTVFRIAFSEIEAGKALGPIHPMSSLLRGTFSFNTAGDLETGPGIDPLNSITASGDATSNSGMIDISSFLTPLVNSTGIDLSNFYRIDFSKWAGKYQVRDGRLGTEDWKIHSKNSDWDIRGSFGFDGSLGYRARVIIPAAAQNEIKNLNRYRDLVDLFRDEKGNIVLDLDIGGSAKSPTIHLDQKAARKKAGEKLLDGLKSGAADKLKDLLNKKK